MADEGQTSASNSRQPRGVQRKQQHHRLRWSLNQKDDWKWTFRKMSQVACKDKRTYPYLSGVGSSSCYSFLLHASQLHMFHKAGQIVEHGLTTACFAPGGKRALLRMQTHTCQRRQRLRRKSGTLLCDVTAKDDQDVARSWRAPCRALGAVKPEASPGLGREDG